MDPEIEVLQLLQQTCATMRVSRKRPELWEAAARKEREIMAEIEQRRTESEPLAAREPVGNVRIGQSLSPAAGAPTTGGRCHHGPAGASVEVEA